MKQCSLLVFLGLLTGVFAFCYVGGGQASAPMPPGLFSYDAEQPESRASGIRLFEQADTATGWDIRAEAAAWYASTQRVVIRQLQARFVEGAMPLLSVEADHGEVVRTTGDMSVYGRVRLHHLEGYTMTTDVLHWQADERLMYTEAPVKITGASVDIRGVGFRSEMAQRRFKIQHSVHATLRLE